MDGRVGGRASGRAGGRAGVWTDRERECKEAEGREAKEKG